MNKRTRLIRIGVTAVLALLFAGSGMATVAAAMNMKISGAMIYLTAAVSIALCGLSASSSKGAVAAAVLFALCVGGYAAGNVKGVSALQELFKYWRGEEIDQDLVLLGGRTLTVCTAFAVSPLFFAMLYRREFVALAALILITMIVTSHALTYRVSLLVSAPGLIAAAAAFAYTGGLHRDFSSLRVLVPSALAVALALLLVPGGRLTWRPLEDAANRVRAVFEQYFNFTRERMAFSINEEGYDHAGEIEDKVVAMLGGPAEPRNDPVMEVHAEADVLLRGAIRTYYTGYSWVDVTPKSRYLYYDITHRAVRDRVFNRNAPMLADAYVAEDVSVRMMDEGTSTLFVPGTMDDFSMDFTTAVYYNTAGEVFLARQVQPGDAYSLKARVPVEGSALRSTLIQAEAADDDGYEAILSAHTALPEGIDREVYNLAMDITHDAQTPYDRAMAIAAYLRANMRYTLDVVYPPRGRDFVSHFLLDTQEGYCSYYASAMAVMGRIAGLPTRYVEGFLARPGDRGMVVLTGQDAHAWVEVYFKGFGWVPFDPTGGVTGSGNMRRGASDPDGSGDAGQDEEDQPDEGLLDAPTPSPSPTPEPPEESGAEATPAPEPDAPDEPGPRQPPGFSWLWIALAALLLILLALAVMWARARLTRTDPARLCGEAESAQEAAMILYRANLTLLAHMGQVPANGETPEAFVARVSKQLDSPDYAAFVRAVTLSRYGRKPLEKADLRAGLRAYAGFRGGMRRTERLRFDITRLFRGLGDFESIP